MELFCQDRGLNISPTTCARACVWRIVPAEGPRSLLHMARMNSADLPLLAATLALTMSSVAEVVDRIVASGPRGRACSAELQDEATTCARAPTWSSPRRSSARATR